MIPDEVYDEVARQTDRWLSAYNDQGKSSAKIAALDMEIVAEREMFDIYTKECDAARNTINELIADYDSDEDRLRITDLIMSKIGQTIVGGFVK